MLLHVTTETSVVTWSWLQLGVRRARHCVIFFFAVLCPLRLLGRRVFPVPVPYICLLFVPTDLLAFVLLFALCFPPSPTPAPALAADRPRQSLTFPCLLTKHFLNPYVTFTWTTDVSLLYRSQLPSLPFRSYPPLHLL